MLRQKRSYTSGLLLVASLLLSNVTAFFTAYLWLTPQLVLFESIIWLILAAHAIWTLDQNHGITKFLDALKRNWIIFPFIIFSGLSIFWSVSWEISLYRWLIFLCTIIIGGYIGLRFNLHEMIRILSFFGLFILFISLLFVILIPSIGIMHYHDIQGAWRGVYWHKNHMGLIASLINILFLLNLVDSVRSTRKGILMWGVLYLFSILFIYQSDSVTAYFTAIFLHGLIILALIWLKIRNKIHRSHYLVFFITVIFASLILVINADHIFGFFNRNTTLTGRIPMWTYLFRTYINKQPLGGYGFNAFWYLGSHREAIRQAAGYPDPIVIADNGFIDILVNTGYIGLIFFLIFYIGIWWSSVKFAIQAKDIIGFFPIILMSFTFLANVTWSLIFENENFLMLILVSVLFCISNKYVKNMQREVM
jgi:exopolysaccharide production protein ExoQ